MIIAYVLHVSSHTRLSWKLVNEIIQFPFQNYEPCMSALVEILSFVPMGNANGRLTRKTSKRVTDHHGSEFIDGHRAGYCTPLRTSVRCRGELA